LTMFSRFERYKSGDDPAAEVAQIISSLKTSLRAMFPDKDEPLAIRMDRKTERVRTLEDIRKELGDCRRCPLHRSRTNIVFGAGNPKARLMFVGEGPGEEEDRRGEPFVGKAGQLLTRMIQAIGLQRRDVYITNVVKSRPPGNRNPLPQEIEACKPFLIMQIESIRPGVICALGKVAAQSILETDASISALRGRFQEFRGIPVMPTFHPAYLLRYPQSKGLAWKDLQAVQAELRKPG